MAMDFVGAQPIGTLYRPVPASKLQNNLASYYERTSKFVDQQFQDMVNVIDPEANQKRQQSESDSEELLSTKLRPQGIGAFIDIRV